MLRTIESLKTFPIHAEDELGDIKEVYFDDEQWGVRYLVVETGPWLSRRSVLVSPYSIKKVDNTNQLIQVSLTREQIKNSPDIDTHKPVSRQLEGDYSRYYGYGNYWMGPYLWGMGGYPAHPLSVEDSVPPSRERAEDLAARATDHPEDVHLRSSDKVSGYHILGTDNEIGHVKDFIFDDEAWVIRYLLVDTNNWWPGGKKTLLSTQWVDRIDWTDSTVQTMLTREQIKNSPSYNEDSSLDRNYETQLHQFYGKKGYWG